MTGHYVVEVEASSHGALKAGVLALPRGLTGSRYRFEEPNQPVIGRRRVLGGPRFTTVVVSADEVADDAEAILVATQIAACTCDGMPTAARLVSWPT